MPKDCSIYLQYIAFYGDACSPSPKDLSSVRRLVYTETCMLYTIYIVESPIFENNFIVQTQSFFVARGTLEKQTSVLYEYV